MYTKDKIKDHLRKDSNWELPDDASLEDWENFDEAWDELEQDGEITLSSGDGEGNAGLGDDEDW